jgi:hypothetical protein
MESRTRALGIVLLLLAGASGAVLLEDSWPRPPRGEAFQRLVGGLGFGPAVDLSDCAFGFDPRLDGSCALERGPVPGGGYFCPRHAGSVFFYPPLRPEGHADAPPP